MNEKFIRDLNTTGLFMFDWSCGAVLPLNHPNYYNGRVEISIRKFMNDEYGNIEIEKNKYEISSEIVNKIYNYVEKNIDKLINITLNQSEEAYDGAYDHVCIKYKSVYLDIDSNNIKNSDDLKLVSEFKEFVKDLILNNAKTKDTKLDNLEKVVNDLIGTDDMDMNNFIVKLVKEIYSFPYNQYTTIAELMRINTVMVEPLLQGEVFLNFKNVCRELGINIEENRDGFGGLAYHVKFMKKES